MAVEDEPEVNLACRIIDLYHLSPPIDVEHLVKKYATLKYVEIPFDGADGVSINLRVPGKTPIVIVNTANSGLRQRFTLAHELGHLLIPWHFGTIIDRVDFTLPKSSSDYWHMETEAYGFAAELLMPRKCVETILSVEMDLAKASFKISNICRTSAHATALRMSRLLPDNIVYASNKNGKVEFSGRTDGTLACALPIGSHFVSTAYDYCEQHYEAKLGNRDLHWWRLPKTLKLPTKDKRGWRDILDHILCDMGIPPHQRTSKALSINGVVGAANGRVRGSRHYGIDAVIAACVQRFKDRPEYFDFTQHPDFKTFVARRAADLVKG